MHKIQYDFKQVFNDIVEYIKIFGIKVIVEDNMEHYFKGDLDGKHIFVADHLIDEAKLFCLLHLVGHTVQWNVSEELKELGSKIWKMPSEQKIKELQDYEWEANCYALWLLYVNGHALGDWLYEEYIADMNYLTHYYRTGQKLKELRDLPAALAYNKKLEIKAIPTFNAVANPRTRKGIVIDF